MPLDLPPLAGLGSISSVIVETREGEGVVLRRIDLRRGVGGPALGGAYTQPDGPNWSVRLEPIVRAVA